jgi:exopolyphosphatase/guanosine-5'-triphosphate,3'-diphosphate pyrophosphatase
MPGSWDAPTLVGTAGTVWTLAAVELGVDAGRRDLIDHFRLTRAAAEEVFRTLATEPVDQRRHNPGLEPGRVDVIVGGAIVVVGVMRHWAFESLLVSEADILDGLARDMV